VPHLAKLMGKSKAQTKANPTPGTVTPCVVQIKINKTKQQRKQNRTPRRRAGKSRMRMALVSKTSVPKLLTTSTRNSRIRQDGTTSYLPNGLHAQICSQIDPFCGHAVGAKVASTTVGALTGTFQERQYLNFGTDANGNGFYIISNSLSDSYASGTQAANGSILTVNAFTNYPSYTSFGGANSTAAYRPVSWGFKFTYTGSDYNNQGTKYAVRLPAANPTTLASSLIGATPAILSSYIPESSVTRLPEPLVYIGRPQSQMAHENFISVAPTDLGDFEQVPWGGIVLVGVNGAQASSTSIGIIEIVINYEYQMSLAGIDTFAFASKVQNPVAGPSEMVSSLAGRVRQGLAMFFNSVPVEAVTENIARRVSMVLAGNLRRMIM
jgi:hypothetical protein